MAEKLNLTQEQQERLLERNRELETEKYYSSLLDERIYRATILQALARLEAGLKDLKEVIEEVSSEEESEDKVSKAEKDERVFKEMWKKEESKPQASKGLPKAWTPDEEEPDDTDDYPEDEPTDEPEEDWDTEPKRKGRPRGS